MAVTYVYNADRQRVGIDDGSQQQGFVYDAAKLLAEYDTAEGSTTAQYTDTLEDTYGDLVSQHRPDEQLSGGETSYHAFDGLGSTDALLNPSEAATDTWQYKAFGEILHRTGSSANPFTFVGKFGYYANPEIDLYYLNDRYYSPAEGRFVSQDSLGFAAGDGNLYRYVRNQPLRAVDPSGRKRVSGFFVWLYTGQWSNDEELYNAAMGAAGEYYFENAGDTHRTLNRISDVDPTGLAGGTRSVLSYLEGDDLHDQIMDRGRLKPPPQPIAVPAVPGFVPNLPDDIPIVPPQLLPNPAPRQPAQNPGQQVTEIIHDWGPLVIVATALLDQYYEEHKDECNPEDPYCEQLFHLCIMTKMQTIWPGGRREGESNCGACRDTCNVNVKNGVPDPWPGRWRPEEGARWMRCDFWAPQYKKRRLW